MDTVLLVDDNPLRALLRQSLLESPSPTAALRVVRALDAAEALCLVESPDIADSLSMVVTPHQMTGISGPEFVAEFRSRMPNVPVLVLTDTPEAESQYADIENVFHSQTTSPEELRTIVKQMLAVDQRRTA